MVTFWGVLLVLGVLAVARYGADSRTEADPTGRDPVLSGAPSRAHSPGEDVSRLGRLLAHHVRAWEAYDRAMRPWQAPQAPPAPAAPAGAVTPRC